MQRDKGVCWIINCISFGLLKIENVHSGKQRFPCGSGWNKHVLEASQR